MFNFYSCRSFFCKIFNFFCNCFVVYFSCLYWTFYLILEESFHTSFIYSILIVLRQFHICCLLQYFFFLPNVSIDSATDCSTFSEIVFLHHHKLETPIVPYTVFVTPSNKSHSFHNTVL